VRRNIAYALPHELRTPLFGITGYAQLLKMGGDSLEPGQMLEFADAILLSSARLQRLIENFLVYAQIDMIGDDPHLIEELHNHFIRDAVGIAAKEAQLIATQHGRESDLRLDLCDPTALQISEPDLRKITHEIVDNAFKFSQPGSEVLVSMNIMDDHLVLSIADQGQGMTDEDISSIGAFMQFDRVLHEQQGMGLGLAIAKRLTELHDGKMTVQSQAGEGTLVSIEFRCE
jgi:signal transduction histidine kinase